MAQYVKALANKAGDLNLSPVTHMEGEDWLPQLSSDPHMLTGTHCT